MTKSSVTAGMLGVLLLAAGCSHSKEGHTREGGGSPGGPGAAPGPSRRPEARPVTTEPSAAGRGERP